MSKYVNPYTDFGFKRLFGTEANKDVIIDFLNELVDKEHKIIDLSFKNTENHGIIESNRKAIFDIFCETANGEKIIVEMQKAKINYFKDRAVFYTTFPIKEQAKKGEWNFKLKPIYCIAILDFEFEKVPSNTDYRNDITLKNQYCEVFYDKLKYIFLEMPRFNKEENELTNHFEKWLYFLKNLPNFDKIPEILNEPIFQKGFEIARISSFNQKQLEIYEKDLIAYWDSTAVVETAHEEGKKEGKIEIAQKMLDNNLDVDLIQKCTGLSIEEIKKIKGAK